MKPKPSTDQAPVQWESDPLDWTRSSGLADELLAALAVRQKRQKRRRIAGAAAALLVIGFVSFLALPRFLSAPDPAPSGRAVVTAPLRQTLSDGTVVEFKPGALIKVNFTPTSPGLREVTLTQGEALFHVAKNPSRPFVVTAAGVRFRAVGTAFAVDLRSASVEMLVTEGTVAVVRDRAIADRSSELAARPDSVPSNSDLRTPISELLITAGHRIEVPLAQAPAPEVLATTTAEAAVKLAWRVPRLEFNETPLWEVVSLLNQHSGSHIILANSNLGRVEISGALRADNIEPLLETLQANYKIQVLRLPDGEIELKQAQ